VSFRVVRQVHRRNDPEIADIGNVMTKLDQRLIDAGNAQGRRAHGGTPSAGAFFERRADEGDRS
jgi:hypothetical protein